MGKKSHPLSPATATTCYHSTYKGGEGEGAQHPPSPPYSRLLHRSEQNNNASTEALKAALKADPL